MAKKCTSSPSHDRSYIAGLPDDELLRGLRSHADPAWWKKSEIQRINRAYLRRWGTYLRREARQRGLL